MEKRRRERINRSLEELKNLILDSATTNVSKNKKILFLLKILIIIIIIILECS